MEARRSAKAFLARARKKTIVVKPFRDGFLPFPGRPVKECFEELKKVFTPDVIFTHYRHDLHQDHRLVCELTWNTFRDHLIIDNEIPKYDADLQSPNFFVPLSDAHARKKVKNLNRYFTTQQNKQWFSEELFYGLMRLRADGGRLSHALRGSFLLSQNVTRDNELSPVTGVRKLPARIPPMHECVIIGGGIVGWRRRWDVTQKVSQGECPRLGKRSRILRNTRLAETAVSSIQVFIISPEV